MTTSAIRKRFGGISHLIGNTPLLGIEFTYRGENRVIYAKAENLNLTGSIKDRMALHILRRGYERGTLEPGDRIIEATSGNTGIAFAAIGTSDDSTGEYCRSLFTVILISLMLRRLA